MFSEGDKLISRMVLCGWIDSKEEIDAFDQGWDAGREFLFNEKAYDLFNNWFISMRRK